MSVVIKDKVIGDDAPCFITFEAGPTHSGLRSAIDLVKLASKAGADAIKFQIMDPDRLVADKQQLFSYDVLVDKDTNQTETVSEPLYDILARRYLSNDEWREVKSVADQEGIAFFATVGFDEDIELLESIGCDSIKIASADVNHIPLIKRAAKTGMCIQLDTGRSTIGEVEKAVDAILLEGNESIIIHQCPSGYPARLSSIHLNMIPTLKTMFPFPAAFSDHTPGWDMDIAAVALGANLVEKTITFDRTTRSVEHIFSLEEADAHAFVRAIRDLELALGEPRRLMHPEEYNKRDSIRRSAFVKQALTAGHQITEDDIDYRRPGFGIAPADAERLVGRSLAVDKKAGDLFDWSDLQRETD